jgi:SAM-dependent methyltransferase
VLDIEIGFNDMRLSGKDREMSAPSGQPTSVGTDAQDYGDSYYHTYGGIDEPYDWASPHWRSFFTMVADRIRAVTNPSSVLDVGCARGLLVQAFYEQGVDAYGIDVSQRAIETAHPDVASRLSVGSAEEIEGAWDLITCLEVLEHMAPSQSEHAIDSMCAASDRVLMSSTPSHFPEPTHINVREPAGWAASFAERGFFRRTDVELSFLATWAVLFERADLTRRDLVYRYEHYAYPMRVEVLEKRAALLDAHRKIGETEGGGGEPDAPENLPVSQRQSGLDQAAAANLELRHKLLTSRDHAIGAEAEAAQWRLRYEQAAAKLERVVPELDRAVIELDQTRGHLYTAYNSTTWRVGKAIVSPISKLRNRH